MPRKSSSVERVPHARARCRIEPWLSDRSGAFSARPPSPARQASLRASCRRPVVVRAAARKSPPGRQRELAAISYDSGKPRMPSLGSSRATGVSPARPGRLGGCLGPDAEEIALRITETRDLQCALGTRLSRDAPAAVCDERNRVIGVVDVNVRDASARLGGAPTMKCPITLPVASANAGSSLPLRSFHAKTAS